MTPSTCKIEGCVKPQGRRGMCFMHLSRVVRHGDPNANMRRDSPIKPISPDLRTVAGHPASSLTARPGYERAAAVILGRLRQAEHGCWEWTGSTNTFGYGTVFLPNTSGLVHRALWTAIRSDVERGLHLDHLCRNRLCANLDHLEVVTPLENNRRKSQLPRGQFGPVLDLGEG